MYVIAVDANGTRERQKSLSSIASFEFIKKDGQIIDYNFMFTEFEETSFQHFSYALPALDEDAEGSYALTLGCYEYSRTLIIRISINRTLGYPNAISNYKIPKDV